MVNAQMHILPPLRMRYGLGYSFWEMPPFLIYLLSLYRPHLLLVPGLVAEQLTVVGTKFAGHPIYTMWWDYLQLSQAHLAFFTWNTTTSCWLSWVERPYAVLDEFDMGEEHEQTY